MTAAAPARIAPVARAYAAPAAFLFAITAMALGAWGHESWADEAQAWLLARDASLFELWTRLLHYEGSPGLWHTLVHPLAASGAPYWTLRLVSFLLAAFSSCLIVFRLPFPVWVRYTLPLTYFLCYQYAVVARSYTLLPPVLFAIAVVEPRTPKRSIAFTLLVSALSLVSVHGFALAILIWGWTFWHYSGHVRSRLLRLSPILLGALLISALSAWPAADVTFPFHRDYSLPQLGPLLWSAFSEAFTGFAPLSLAAVALSTPFLRRGHSLWLFLACAVSLIAIGAFLHVQVWHHGILFLAWITCLWLGCRDAEPGRRVLTALGVVIVVQCWWTIAAVRYDLVQNYSGSRNAAAALHRIVSSAQSVFAIGYSSTALQPYFPRNPFQNWNHAEPAGFWPWAASNRADDPAAIYAATPPEYVVVGFKSPSERAQWLAWLNPGGYHRVRAFPGRIFWRTAPYESEAFDVYRRANLAPPLSSSITMSDPASARQLLDGFSALEANSWRWAAPRASVILSAPNSTLQSGGQFTVRCFLPPDHLRTLGSITLSPSIAGKPLPPVTFTTPGENTYSARLPASALRAGPLAASLDFDKAAPPSPTDARRLAAIVTFIGLSAF